MFCQHRLLWQIFTDLNFFFPWHFLHFILFKKCVYSFDLLPDFWLFACSLCCSRLFLKCTPVHFRPKCANLFLHLFITLLFLLKADHFSGCSGGDLCDFRHVLHPRQLRPLPHPGAGDQGQAPAVCQRGEPVGVLGDQLLLGHGEFSAGLRLQGSAALATDPRSLCVCARWTTPSAPPWWSPFSWHLTKNATRRPPTCLRWSRCFCSTGQAPFFSPFFFIPDSSEAALHDLQPAAKTLCMTFHRNDAIFTMAVVINCNKL